MTLDVDEFFDNHTLAALRSLRRDRKLTIAAGVRAWEAAEGDGLELTRFIACIDLDHKHILSGSSAREDERDEALVAMLLQAMLNPETPARPRLPRRVIVEKRTIADAIERPLRRLGVDVVVAPVLALDALVKVMRAALASLPTWFRDTATGLPLYQAAAALWAAAPWELLPDEQASAAIAIGGPINRTLHAICAEADELAGVMFLLSDADFELMSERAESTAEGGPDAARLLADFSISSYDMLTVVYADAEDTDDEDIEHADEKRWPIGSGSAYPRFARAGDGDQPRQINDEEARLLALAMDGLARFCFAERTRLARGEIPVSAEVRVRDGDELVVASVFTPAKTR